MTQKAQKCSILVYWKSVLSPQSSCASPWKTQSIPTFFLRIYYSYHIKPPDLFVTIQTELTVDAQAVLFKNTPDMNG